MFASPRRVHRLFACKRFVCLQKFALLSPRPCKSVFSGPFPIQSSRVVAILRVRAANKNVWPRNAVHQCKAQQKFAASAYEVLAAPCGHLGRAVCSQLLECGYAQRHLQGPARLPEPSSLPFGVCCKCCTNHQKCRNIFGNPHKLGYPVPMTSCLSCPLPIPL